MRCCCPNDQVVKTTLEKGETAGYQKEAQVCVIVTVKCVAVLSSILLSAHVKHVNCFRVYM